MLFLLSSFEMSCLCRNVFLSGGVGGGGGEIGCGGGGGGGGGTISMNADVEL